MTAQEKEALADEEMMKMLDDGALDEIDTSEQDLSSSSIADDILDGIDEIEVGESSLSMDNITTEDDIQQMLADETAPTVADEPEEEVSIDEIEATDTADEPAIEEIEIPEEAESLELEDDISTDSAQGEQSIEIELDAGDAMEAVDSLEEAISIDHGTKEIVEELQKATQEVNSMALATAKKAQASAEQTQQAIESTFAAAEKAFNTVKNSGYVLDPESFKSNYSKSELEDELDAIKQKNEKLKEANEIIKKRLQALKP